MIHDASTLVTPLRLRADVCVVGSGAGGMSAALAAAEAGLSVLVLEAGELVTPDMMSGREEEMVPRLFWDHGGRATEDRAVTIHQGRGVGGSTLHNTCLVKRIPRAVFTEWLGERRLSHLPPERLDALYSEVERMIGVRAIPEARWSPHNRLLERGCRELGWAGGGLRHNRSGCVGSGYCELGCRHDAKNNALRVFAVRAVRAGARILSRCQAIRVRHRSGRVEGVEAVALHPETRAPMGRIEIDARQVCLAASATATAALLLRSEVPDPSGRTGRDLRVHPAVVVAGDFEERVEAWRGIPQSYECTEHLDFEAGGGAVGARTWIVPAFAHPVATATMLPGVGQAHREIMRRYPHMAVLTAMIHDRSRGRVEPRGDLGVRIDYEPDADDRRELRFGLEACAQLLFAAGARRVLVPSNPLVEIRRGGSLAPLRGVELSARSLRLTAVHPMGSVPMDDRPDRAAVDSRGAHHRVEGLHVADGSLFPTSIGVPPQLSIYALGRHVGQSLAAARRI